MALYDDFPYTNFHSLNLDWIVKKLSELENGESTEESSSTATLARNLSGNYPYTNFHSLNLDWIIRSMVGLESDFETLENEWQNLRATVLLNDQIKNAILQCFENVAWVNDRGQQYYNALRDLFFPPVVVSTLTAVLDQGERVFHTGEDVNVIKDYLTVTAELTNGALITVPATQYVLTGSLSEEGPNTIIVSYMNVSTTITVNAVAINLVSISAVYTQSGTVYDTDSLDSLKSDLVVTATYDDSSTATVPSADYTLSGTLAEGTSTITVSYDGKTTTFDVTVRHGVDYTLDAFDDATWEVGKDYNRNTGAYGDATNQVATDKFTVQDCLYQLTGSGATYPGLFAWDEHGNYQGRFESSSFADFPVLGLPSKFTYAFHVYDSNGTFVPSNAHYMPINNSANQTAQIPIRLSDHLEEFTWQSGYGQMDITNILAEYGINASNLNSKINRTSEITFIGGGSNLSFTNSNNIVIYNISPYQGSVYLIPRTSTATNLTNLKAFISENDPVFIINGEV